jgi:hypothetical protein
VSLSDKKQIREGSLLDWYIEKDVKEFIKKLKEVEFKAPDGLLPREAKAIVSFIEAFEKKIDKLAGEDLI